MDVMSVEPLPDDLLAVAFARRLKYASVAEIIKIFTPEEIAEMSVRGDLYEEIDRQIHQNGALSMSYEETAAKIGCKPALVDHAWKFMKRKFKHSGEKPMDLRLVIPGEGRASDLVDETLARAGLVVDITNNRTKTGFVIDIKNGLAPIPCEKLAGVDMFRDLHRNKATPFDLALVGKDVIDEYKAERRAQGKSPKVVRRLLKFHDDKFRMCIAVPEERLKEANKKGWDYFDGEAVVSSYPYTAKAHFKKKGVKVDVLEAKGGVEAKCRRWGAVGIVDVEQSGDTLIKTRMVKFRKDLCPENISLIEPRRPDIRDGRAEAVQLAKDAFMKRLQEAHP